MGTGKFNHLQSSKTKVQKVNLNQLNKIKETDVSSDLLSNLGLIKNNAPYKILGNGEIDKTLNVSANMFSKKAIEKIEKAGGSVSFI